MVMCLCPDMDGTRNEGVSVEYGQNTMVVLKNETVCRKIVKQAELDASS